MTAFIIPAHAGTQPFLGSLAFRFRGNDRSASVRK